MSFEQIKAQIAMMLEDATYQPEDLHEAREVLREQLADLQAQNQTVPQDLKDLMKELDRAFSK
jgi:DNA-binding FadR family transcriptional regulator